MSRSKEKIKEIMHSAPGDLHVYTWPISCTRILSPGVNTILVFLAHYNTILGTLYDKQKIVKFMTPGTAAFVLRCDHIGDIVQNALCFILNPFLSSGTINKRTKYGVKVL